jgi:hypothetical protein
MSWHRSQRANNGVRAEERFQESWTSQMSSAFEITLRTGSPRSDRSFAVTAPSRRGGQDSTGESNAAISLLLDAMIKLREGRRSPAQIFNDYRLKAA